MPRILLMLLLSMASGALLLLACATGNWPIRPGLIGLAAMIASAWLARRHWQRQPPDQRIGSPERSLWHGLASYGLLTGHLAAFVWWLGPGFDLHGRVGHALAVDNWILILGAITSYWIARDPEARHDERDALFAAHGLSGAHFALLAMLALMVIALAFGGSFTSSQFSLPMVAQLLILIMMIHALAFYGLRLWLYQRDAAAERRRS